jgi:hypothetical protein
MAVAANPAHGAREPHEAGSISSAQRALVLLALVVNTAVVALIAWHLGPLALVVLVPLGALPAVGLALARQPPRFRLSMIVIGTAYLGVGVLFMLLGGLAFLPAALLAFAAAVGPAERPGRSRARRVLAALPAAALILVLLVLAQHAFE